MYHVRKNFGMIILSMPVPKNKENTVWLRNHHMQIGYPLAGFAEIGLSIADTWVGKNQLLRFTTRAPGSRFLLFLFSIM
jgi:hypothetical protein